MRPRGYSISWPTALRQGAWSPALFLLLAPIAESVRSHLNPPNPPWGHLQTVPLCATLLSQECARPGSEQVRSSRESMPQELSSTLRCDRCWWINTPAPSLSTGQSLGWAAHSLSQGPPQNGALVAHSSDYLPKSSFQDRLAGDPNYKSSQFPCHQTRSSTSDNSVPPAKCPGPWHVSWPFPEEMVALSSVL